jgi:hypothetical protein
MSQGFYIICAQDWTEFELFTFILKAVSDDEALVRLIQLGFPKRQENEKFTIPIQPDLLSLSTQKGDN